MTQLRRLSLAALALVAVGCFEPNSDECSPGVVCPAGSKCSGDKTQCIGLNDTCGNGVTEGSERCDDGNVRNGDDCRSDCRGRAACGDGNPDTDLRDEQGLQLELCDDGNNVSGDGCSADCKSTEDCGNNISDTARGEECDDGRDGGHECNLSCRLKRCGDNTRDFRVDGGNELCDDGNATSGDGCSADCRSDERCGNGITDTARGEECDGQPDCNACRWKRCGDGVRDTFADGGEEECDEGDGDGGMNGTGPWCSAQCTLKLCGNAITDRLAAWDGGIRSEECDDGNSVEGDTCGNTCLIPRCGNGHLDPMELCDDGNNASGDGCRSDCLGLELCGDNFRDVLLRDGGTEACDDGNRDGGDGCRADCQGTELCGDGKLDPVLVDGGTEVCDDNNQLGGDGCRADCLGVELCGDTFTDPILKDGGFEACDDGNTDAGDGCRADCRGIEICGDNQLDVLRDGGLEICDDGNTVGGDTCAADCQSTGLCGNGDIETNLGEECDDGNSVDVDGCSNLCKLAICGDSIVRSVGAPTEQCDTGGPSATCSFRCTFQRCGDGLVNTFAGEQCDVASTQADAGTETTTCDTDCTVAFCGDNTRNAARGEDCDTGGNTASCNADCTTAVCGDRKVNPNTLPPEQCDTGADTVQCDNDCTTVICGDGHWNADAGEQCDDGNTANDDRCVTNCRLNVCGDGFRNIRDAGFEACDDGNTANETRCAYGTPVCTGCNSACSAVLNLVGPYCGDNTTQADAGEACDDGNTTTESACVYGQTSCTGCAGDCRAAYSLVGNRFCGNGVQDVQLDGGIEPCDDGNTQTETQCPYGVANCSVCSANCQTVIARTGPRCGDNATQTDAGEACDDGNTTNENSCSYGQTSCTGCSSDCRSEYSLPGLAFCGNGVRDTQLDGGLEPCDDGNTITEAECPYGLGSCSVCAGDCQSLVARTGPRCGDNTTQADAGEACDDGNIVNENDCAYGQASCTACASDCRSTYTVTGTLRCGNGVKDLQLDGGLEPCDDGNTTTEAACDYGTASCTACSANCQNTLNLTGNVCGDGVRDPIREQCDDRNTNACGTCNATCTAAQSFSSAQGTIRTVHDADFGANPTEGQTIVLNDGANTPTTFCMRFDNAIFTCPAGQVMIDLTGSSPNADQVADVVVAAINGVGSTLNITATKRTTQPYVALRNDTQGAIGNQPITGTVSINGWVMTGMSGGSGGFDCANGTGCAVHQDCSSGYCNPTTHVCANP
ncbi:MAG: hypothetical protein DI536_06795 [Archangium gephyra]|uniref:Uncharacterized protein n=1 Tax=Archangium gephyra TaxID=48 RepID=A0A2W5TRK2_9BACT|nr:MAG: hypothetical protein DI536_06795 [Archangium gephyra]